MISIGKCIEFITDIRSDLGCYINRKRIKNKEFTIISNDCYGAELYRDLGLEYKTPFIGLMVSAPCYIKLLNNLKEYLDSPLSFVNTSRYEYMNELRQTLPFYPIGKLGEEVEIHFIHYAYNFEAREKWKRRLKRISWNNIFVGFVGDKYLCTEDILSKFDSLPFKNKVVFTTTNIRILMFLFILRIMLLTELRCIKDI